jgi:hypothetical protein
MGSPLFPVQVAGLTRAPPQYHNKHDKNRCYGCDHNCIFDRHHTLLDFPKNYNWSAKSISRSKTEVHRADVLVVGRIDPPRPSMRDHMCGVSVAGHRHIHLGLLFIQAAEEAGRAHRRNSTRRCRVLIARSREGSGQKDRLWEGQFFDLDQRSDRIGAWPVRSGGDHAG